MRKVIQIIQCDDKPLTALCDDGSIWFRSFISGTSQGDWIKISDVPQGEEEKDVNELLLEATKKLGF